MSTTTPRRYIRDLEANGFVDGPYSIQNAQLGQTKNGKPFLKCLIADKTGRTPGRMWNITEDQFHELPTNGFVWIESQVQPYQGEMQLILQKVRTYEPSTDELTELLPSTRHSIDEMFGEVVRLMSNLEHPALKALAETYLGDGDLMDRFCQAPAAQTLHHAYLGGLLEHTASLLRAADALLPLYPQLNRDIVLMGLFLHDLGKCYELKWKTGFGYTTDGQLVGHIARGVLMLEEKAATCANDPDEPVAVPQPILAVLGHIILSHHGTPEFGALKIPATPEAIFISNLDNLDAKMNLAIGEARNPDKPGDAEFTEKIWALDTRLYKPDPTTVKPSSDPA